MGSIENLSWTESLFVCLILSKIWRSLFVRQNKDKSLLLLEHILGEVDSLFEVFSSGRFMMEDLHGLKSFLKFSDKFFLIIFTLELVLNLYVHWMWDYISDSWNVCWSYFDFFVVMRIWWSCSEAAPGNCKQLVWSTRIGRIVPI